MLSNSFVKIISFLSYIFLVLEFQIFCDLIAEFLTGSFSPKNTRCVRIRMPSYRNNAKEYEDFPVSAIETAKKPIHDCAVPACDLKT